MPYPRLTPAAILCASLSLASTLMLTGCTDLGTVTVAHQVSVTGNWQLTAPAAAKLPSLSGELTGTNTTSISGLLHSNSASACVAPATVVEVSGSTDSKGTTTLTGPLAGGTLTLSGTLAADGKSFTTATYNVTGGTCAFTAPAAATAQAYAPITGNYSGTFTDAQGDTLPVTAVMSQTPQSDTSGNFQLSGTGSFASNPCLISPVSVSNTQVTGGSFTVTYADAQTTNTVTASGTFSTDGTKLTVSTWTMTGPCGPLSGTGTLTKQ